MRITSTALALMLAAAPLASCTDEGVDGVAVEYDTPDGLTLRATYNEQNTGPTPTLILLHQTGPTNSRFDWDPLWSSLQTRGYALLAPDLRSHGDSDSDGSWEDLETDPTKYPNDLITWLDFLEGRAEDDGLVSRDAVGILAMGTSASLAVAAMGKGWVNCVVAISPDLETLTALTPGLAEYDPDGDDDDDDAGDDDDDDAGDDDDSAGPEDPFLTLDLDTIRYVVSEGDDPSATDAQTMLEASSDPTDLASFSGSAHGVDMLWIADDAKFAMIDWCDGRF